MLKDHLLESINEGEQLKGHLDAIHQELKDNPKTIVILDDDPTGTQTVYDVPVVTSWEKDVLENEILKSPVFFILTNSRSLQIEEANALGKLLGKRLNTLSKKHNKKLLVISRGDSTLRGHYPNEVNALAEGLGTENAKHILAPAFFEGGRYTYNDIHYVKEGDNFIPAGETPFAKDNTFGYKNSNLKGWIIEKYEGETITKTIESLSIDTLRHNSLDSIISTIKNSNKTHLIINATSYNDLQTATIACLKSDEPLLFRTAASFVNAISGIEARDCLSKKDILSSTENRGSLIIIGSYVPKTTAQLQVLKDNSDAVFLELDVSNIQDTLRFEQNINTLSKKVNQHIKAHDNVVLYTSRTIVKGNTNAESLNIINRVSNGLISIIKKLTSQPKYIVAKGGITSSDVATKGLNVKRALVLGQILKGVSVWKLGNETKFPNMPYIVFPGNVGDNNALHQLTKLLG